MIPPADHPPKLFILPTNASPEARIVTLPNPRDNSPCRYLVCPVKGIFEFTKVAAPPGTPRSWLLARPHASSRCPRSNPARPTESCDNSIPALSSGYISKDANLHVATPIDPLFLLLSTLRPLLNHTKSDPPEQHFLSLEDHYEHLTSSSADFAHLLEHDSIREILESRFMAVCDIVEAGDERMLRLNEELLLRQLADKARRMISQGLPASLEERYVRRALDVPILGIKREASSLSAVSDTVTIDKSEPSETQAGTSVASTVASATSLASTTTSLSTAAERTPTSTFTTPEEIPHLLRLRTALDYLLANYVPAHIASSLERLLATSYSPFDFSPLTEHLKNLASLRQQALAARSLSDFSRKHAMNEDDEAGESRADKKRKKEAEEKRKRAGESHSLRNLKKVDTSGMKKMSAFFSAKPKVKA